jgi:hypothetical protein
MINYQFFIFYSISSCRLLFPASYRGKLGRKILFKNTYITHVRTFSVSVRIKVSVLKCPYGRLYRTYIGRITLMTIYFIHSIFFFYLVHYIKSHQINFSIFLRSYLKDLPYNFDVIKDGYILTFITHYFLYPDFHNQIPFIYNFVTSF